MYNCDVNQAIVNLLKTKNFWNISTIKDKTHKLWMNNKDILSNEEAILLRYGIVGARKIVYEYPSICISSKLLLSLYYNNYARYINSTTESKKIIDDFKNQDEIFP